MKKYIALEIEVESAELTDVIATSADVTTEAIPWKNSGSPASYQFFELTRAHGASYNLD